jgi:hypothetical protein
LSDHMFTREDLELIRGKGLTLEDVVAQVAAIRNGFPPADLDRACTVGDGILRLEEEETKELGALYDEAARSGRAMKFVPASGAATRMFRLLQAARNRGGSLDARKLQREALEGDTESAKLLRFFGGLKELALYEPLQRVMADHGLDADACLNRGLYGEILEHLMGREGLNAADMPKGLIPFHSYPGGAARTPFEEHMVEALLTVKDGKGISRVHFTASPGHEQKIRHHLEEKRASYEVEGAALHTDVSIQMPHTDTIALDMEGRPFRDRDGRILFRPGGHGALLENLDMLDGDLVFIKNIDNVVPDRMKRPTVIWKKALGGLLVNLQEEAALHFRVLSEPRPGPEALEAAWLFVRQRLFVQPPAGLDSGSPERKRAFLLSRLNRPMRVCGMVQNKGEPGGGPFWVRHEDGSLTMQIVESSQVDMESERQKSVWNSSTHFNPVDLVCALRGFDGSPFDLHEYRDPQTGFVAVKSSAGRELRALELPGLWNGAMAWWNTIFVEVPIETFNPVKTVLDLLRDEHRNT